MELTAGLDEFLQYLQLECGLSRNTLNAYRTDILAFLRFVDCKLYEDVKASDINRYIKSLIEAGARPATLARKITSLKRFFGYFAERNDGNPNPAQGFSAPRLVRYHPDYLSTHDIEQILKAAAEHPKTGLRDCAILELLYGSGLRLSELIHLRRVDIEFAAGFIRVTGKGNKQRLVPLGDYARAALERYLQAEDARPAAQNSDLVFVGRQGRPFSRAGIWKLVRRVVARAGVTRHVSPHTFRHSFATHLLEGGADLRVVQEMLGHADISTTEVYTQIDRDYIRAEHRKYHPRELAGFKRAEGDG